MGSVNDVWTDPTTTLDLANGATVTETHWDAVMSNLYHLGGSTGDNATRTLSNKTLDNSCHPGAAGYRFHRHPYANDRHIESGKTQLARDATASITFTDAFAASPAVATNNEGPVGYARAYSVGVGGFTLQSQGVDGTQWCHWIAEGQD